MSRTALISAELPNSLWDKASAWAAYAKNRLPHESLPNQKTPVELLLDRDQQKARSNLRPFGQKVNFVDYEVRNKLSARSWEGRIVGYTMSHGIYQVMMDSGSFKLAKNPMPVQKDLEEEDEQTLVSEETRDTPEEILEGDSESTETRPKTPTLMPEPPPAPRKK